MDWFLGVGAEGNIGLAAPKAHTRLMNDESGTDISFGAWLLEKTRAKKNSWGD